MRGQRVIAGAGLLAGTLVIASGLAAVIGGRRAAPPAHHLDPPPPTSTTIAAAVSAAGWRQVVPATTVPADTPVQQQYDKGFEAGFSSASNEAMMSEAEALPLAPPAVSGGWPTLGARRTPEGWATEFVSGLLDIDFAHESRSALGGWLVAEGAPDLMPGIPPAFEDRALFVSVMEPSITGEPSPVPSAAEWNADAAAGVRWSVRDLEVQLNPQWQQMIDAGWQPPDIRSAVEDVSGLLTTTRAAGRTTARFSIVVQVGSARWDDGYGTVLVSSWRGP